MFRVPQSVTFWVTVPRSTKSAEIKCINVINENNNIVRTIASFFMFYLV